MALTHLVELVQRLRKMAQDNPHTQILALDAANDIETALLKAEDDNIVWGSEATAAPAEDEGDIA